jgi:hypothetical protein
MKTLNNKCQHLLHFIAINTQRNIGYAFYTCNISQYMLNVHWRMVFSNEKDVHNALIPLLKKGYIVRVHHGVYMITLLGVQYFGDTFSELCAALQSEKNTQPEEIEQPKQNDNAEITEFDIETLALVKRNITDNPKKFLKYIESINKLISTGYITEDGVKPISKNALPEQIIKMINAYNTVVR